ncbi:MAG: HlyD family secretion protein [Niabella sp.]
MENNSINEITEQKKTSVKKKRSPVFYIILAVMLALGAYLGITKYIHSKYHEETDDAQVEANLSPVISKISGYVNEVRVKDNQYVKKGDTLVILDQRDLKMALEQAEATLGIARSSLSSSIANTVATDKNVGTANAAVQIANAQIEAAKVNVWRTTEDLKRYANLINDHSITQQQYEQVLAAKQSADKQLQVLLAQQQQATAQTNVVKGQVAASSEQSGVAKANIRQSEVAVENAQLNLSYTYITAAESGYVSKVPLQTGQFIQAGAQLFSIVLDDSKWIIANFKETQVSHMVEGQKVIVKIDAFPKHEFPAKLTSFSPATGARFALLPPDNASGNFVKVVQRLPVKIEFDNPGDSLIKKLRAGMNAVVEVELK